MNTLRRYSACIFAAALVLEMGCGGGHSPSNTGVTTTIEPVVDPCVEATTNACEIQAVTSVSLSWDTPFEVVDGYLIYVGSTAETTETPIGDFPYTSLALVDSTLLVTVELAKLAPLHSSGSFEAVCFRLRSYNVYGISGYSRPACVNQIP